MNPTLKVGDGLTVIPYGENKIRVGDVVVFRSPERERYIVHRVVSIDSRGVRTKGDNNDCIDAWVLHPRDIVGRVVSARRRNRKTTIHGGARGRLLVRHALAMKRAEVAASRILRPAYCCLARSGIFRNALSRLVKTQLLCFRRPNGMEMQLLMGRRIIARRPQGRSQWQIRRPFRLLVDEASLPRRKPDHLVAPESNIL